MEKAAELLTIIVSSVLVVFLIVMIIAMVKIIQVAKSLERIVQKAEKLANSAESIGSFFNKAATPVAFSRFVYNVTQSVLHHEKKKRGDEE